MLACELREGDAPKLRTLSTSKELEHSQDRAGPSDIHRNFRFSCIFPMSLRVDRRPKQKPCPCKSICCAEVSVRCCPAKLVPHSVWVRNARLCSRSERHWSERVNESRSAANCMLVCMRGCVRALVLVCRWKSGSQSIS